MATYIKIATVTVGAGGAASMDFTSISSIYTDLLLKLSARSANATTGTGILLSINSNASITGRNVYGAGSGTPPSTSSGQVMGFAGGTTTTASTFTNTEIYIPNYTGSTNKSISADSVQENNATEAYAVLTAGLWSNTSAINALSVSMANGNFVQYSTATLYGISKS